jgi:hypothetical protein
MKALMILLRIGAAKTGLIRGEFRQVIVPIGGQAFLSVIIII